MVRMYARLTLMVGMFALLGGCGDSPVEVSLEPSSMGSGSRVVITSRVDDVELQGFVINRGNCLGSFFEKGRHLKFGQSSRVFSPCGMNDIKEFEIKTDQGEFNFSFD